MQCSLVSNEWYIENKYAQIIVVCSHSKETGNYGQCSLQMLPVSIEMKNVECYTRYTNSYLTVQCKT